MRTFGVITLITLALSCIVSVTAECGSGWRAYEDACYHMSNDTETFITAKAICEMFDSWLVEIETQEENEYLQIQVNKFNKLFWIGLSDLEAEGEWEWLMSRTTPTYTNWSEDAPNNMNDNENCAFFKPDGFWNDIPCSGQVAYICEKNNLNPDQVGKR